MPNVSEGRRREVITALRHAVERVDGCWVLDVHSDVDHNRSVFTLAGTPTTVKAGVLELAAAAVEMVDMRAHEGVHPCIGALDVVPFSPLAGVDLEGCVALARATGEALAAAHALPVYLYAAAAAPGRPDRLVTIRHGGFKALAAAERIPLEPDFGPGFAHPTAGAASVGAREALIAFNLLLDSRELAVAKGVAALVRESDSGLSGVQALGLYLPSRDHVQVSMNLLDYETTPLDALVDAVRRAAASLGATVVAAELVGLAPQNALRAANAADLPGMPDLGQSIEARLEACSRRAG